MKLQKQFIDIEAKPIKIGSTIIYSTRNTEQIYIGTITDFFLKTIENVYSHTQYYVAYAKVTVNERSRNLELLTSYNLEDFQDPDPRILYRFYVIE